MRSRIGPRGAFFVGFSVGFSVTLVAGLALGLPFFFLLSFFGGGALVLELVLLAALADGVVLGVAGFVMYALWGSLTKGQQFILITILLVLGIAFVQPELDAVAFMGLALTYGGVQKGIAQK